MEFKFGFAKGLGLFEKKVERKQEKTIVTYDYSDMNHLPLELKVLVVKAHAAIQEGEAILNGSKYHLDLTSKRQLKTDIRHVEKCIEALSHTNKSETSIKNLENAIVRLNTVAKGLKQFFA